MLGQTLLLAHDVPPAMSRCGRCFPLPNAPKLYYGLVGISALRSKTLYMKTCAERDDTMHTA